MTTIQFRRGTAAEWTAANPVLAVGEPGYETDTGQQKIGNGTSAWKLLAYTSPTVAPASTIAAGVVKLSTDVQADVETNNTTAMTPFQVGRRLGVVPRIDPITGVVASDDLGAGSEGLGTRVLYDNGTWAYLPSGTLQALSQLSDVFAPIPAYDVDDNLISPGPSDGDTLIYNAELDVYEVKASPLSPEMFAPAGYTPKNYVPAVIVPFGQAVPSGLVNGTAVIQLGAPPASQAINYVGGMATTSGGTATTNISGALPPGAVLGAGDLMLFFVDTSDHEATIPTGWARLARVVKLTSAGLPISSTDVFSKIAVTGQVAPSCTTADGTSTRYNTNLVAYRGVDQINPIIINAGQGEASNTDTHNAPALDNPNPAAWGIYHLLHRNATPASATAGPGLVERLDIDMAYSGANNASQTSDSNGPVSVGNVVYSGISSASTAISAMWAVLLRPAGSSSALNAATVSVVTAAKSVVRPNPPMDLVSLNITQTTVGIGFTPATTSMENPEIVSYELIQDGVQVRTYSARLTNGDLRANVLVTGLAEGRTYTWYLQSVDVAGATSVASVTVSAKTLVASGVPGAPTLLTVVATRRFQVDLAWTAGTPDPNAPTLGTRVYPAGETGPLAEVVGSATTITLSGLTPGTSYPLQVRHYNDVGESVVSNTVTADTLAGTTAAKIMRTDHVIDYSGFNTKVTYGTGTHGATDANRQAVIDHSVSLGQRVHRQQLATGGTAQTRQQAYITAMHTAWGTRMHVTVGDMRFKAGVNIPGMTDSELRVYARGEVESVFAVMANAYWRGLAGAGNSLTRVFSEIAGPNEIEEAASTGPNWPSHARIWQQAIYMMAREGKVWDETTSRWVLSRPEYVSLFAGIPIAGPSTRTDLTLAKAELCAGPLRADGTRPMQDWVEVGNCHLYQQGSSPSRRIEEMKAAYAPMVKGGVDAPFVFSETGYNHMGFDKNGTWVGPARIAPSGFGQKRVPPWAIATYVVRAICDFAIRDITYVKHEFLDDYDPGTALTNSDATHWNQEHFFGSIATPQVNPTSWALLPDYYALRRLHNLLKDRSDPKVVPTHATAVLPHTIINNGGIGTLLQTDRDDSTKMFTTQKADGTWWAFLWRDVNVWNYDTSGTGPGSELMVADKTITIRLDHASGTRTVSRWRPNKATSASVGTTASWETVPAVDQSWSVGPGGTFSVALGANLEVLRIA